MSSSQTRSIVTRRGVSAAVIVMSRPSSVIGSISFAEQHRHRTGDRGRGAEDRRVAGEDIFDAQIARGP